MYGFSRLALNELNVQPVSRRDRGAKQAIYAREGAGYLWFVDPDARSLEAFELLRGRWVPLAKLKGSATVSLPPFDAIQFSLSDLWPTPTPAPD